MIISHNATTARRLGDLSMYLSLWKVFLHTICLRIVCRRCVDVPWCETLMQRGQEPFCWIDFHTKRTVYFRFQAKAYWPLAAFQ